VYMSVGVYVRVQLYMRRDKHIALLDVSHCIKIDPHPDPPYLYVFLYLDTHAHTLSGCWSCACICAVCLRNLRRCEMMKRGSC
jgi:hypothetical protein